MAKQTKTIIIDTFFKILETTSFDKITVKDICTRCEINRNTFYYYFKDIQDVLEARLEKDRKKVLAGVGSNEDFYMEYVRSVSIILENRQAIIHVYNSRGVQLLQNYLEDVIMDFVRRFVCREAEGKNLAEEDIDYITKFYSFVVVGSTMHWIADGLKDYGGDIVYKISESVKATIDGLITMCINNRNLEQHN